MAKAPDNEQRVLEEKLSKALDEAWAKANAALKDSTAGTEGREKQLWAAAEASEYCSLLFSLRHDLEDTDPPVKEKRGVDQVSLVQKAVEALHRVRASRNKPSSESYQDLRKAVYCLRRAYLGKQEKREVSK